MIVYPDYIGIDRAEAEFAFCDVSYSGLLYTTPRHAQQEAI